MAYSSKLIEQAIIEVAKLPGIGKKSALRIVLHLLRQEPIETNLLARGLEDLRENIKYCTVCYNISDAEVCTICSSHKRDETLICVVEDIRDVMAIENTEQDLIFLGDIFDLWVALPRYETDIHNNFISLYF